MDHQPFETWILDAHSQPPEDSQALRQHLEACPRCRALQVGWQAAEHTLGSVPMLNPQPGFSMRWQAGLAQRRALQQARQVRVLLLSLGLGALASLVVLILIYLESASPADLLIGAVRLITNLNGWLVTAQRLIASLLSHPLPLVLWIAAGCGLCLLVTTWVLTLWRISVKGVNQNEKYA